MIQTFQTFICPICSSELSRSNETMLIYNCYNEPAPVNYEGHYACDLRYVEGQFVHSQEDFIYWPYIIYKIIDINTSKPEKYFVACDWDQKNHDRFFRWNFTLSPEEFNNMFPNFNPKDIDSIMNKFDFLNLFY